MSPVSLDDEPHPIPIIQTTQPDDEEQQTSNLGIVCNLSSPAHGKGLGSFTRVNVPIQRTISESVDALDLGITSYRSDGHDSFRASSSARSHSPSIPRRYQISQNVLLLGEQGGQNQVRKLKDLKEEADDPMELARACTALGEKLLPAASNLHGGLVSMFAVSERASSIITQITNHWEANKKFNWEHPEKFGLEVLELCRGLEPVLMAQEYPLLHLRSPLYILGDLHGNFDDTIFYMSNLINLGDIRYTGTSFLFLGDYVDKGPYSVEVTAYLLALKALAPDQVWLLRGNHETRQMQSDVPNGFHAQCATTFARAGDLYEALHRIFDLLPLAAIVDRRIFCVHGGIPRLCPGEEDDRLQFLEDGLQWQERRCTPLLQEVGDTDRYQRFFTDLLWADPALEEEEGDLDACGFGPSPRGEMMSTFGHRAIAKFLEHTDLQFIIRAHEWMDFGLQVAKRGKVITIFSSSRYNNQTNNSAVIFVKPSDGKIRFASRGQNGQ
eukprot:EG_transcript_6307